MKTGKTAAKKTRRRRTAVSFNAGPAFDLKSYLSRRRQEVDAALERCLPPASHFPARLHGAMRHSLFSGGKRLRPILVLAAAEACGGSAKAVMPAACALEFIHTYSLIHDDLPAMDDDRLRRGQPTCHIAFGEGAAILAGDALLTAAFELLAQTPAANGAGAKRIVAAVGLLARGAGAAGMVGGQMADLEAEGQEITLPLLQYIHTHKTGMLIQAALLIGAELAGASAAQHRALALYGEAMGLAFQIADDVLDVVGEAARLGKHTGGDQAAGKATYPALFGVEESRRQAQALSARACRAVRPLGPAARPLAALAQFAVEREV
jgi:geranylgeranyl diphosphate synthase, type II